MHLRTVGAVVSALALSACASVSGFAKSGGSYDEYLADRFACMKIASGPRCANDGLYVSCMAQKGWRQGSEGFRPPAEAVIAMCPGS
jgi:hypothetical protein